MPHRDPNKRRATIIASKAKARRLEGVPVRAFLTIEQRKAKRAKQQKIRRQRNPKATIASIARWRHKLRQTVIELYGGKCACCGESEFAFLAIDHVDGGGSKHIKSFTSYPKYLVWLKIEIRDGFRVLCHNCNMARARLGSCPHGNGI